MFINNLLENFNKLLVFWQKDLNNFTLPYIPYKENAKDKYQSCDAFLGQDSKEDILNFLSKSIDFYLKSFDNKSNKDLIKNIQNDFIENLKQENKNLSNLLNATKARLELLQTTFKNMEKFYQNSLKEKNKQLEEFINKNSLKK